MKSSIAGVENLTVLIISAYSACETVCEGGSVCIYLMKHPCDV